MQEIKVALFGVGGYAGNYIYTITNHQREDVKVTLVGAVDPFNKNCDLCPVYDTAEELYTNHKDIDLVAIGTPIHCHVPQAVEALRRGYHVTLEKPMAATLAGVQQILDARDQSGKLLSIGFNMCADAQIRALKADLQAGVFGKPLRFRTIVLWPRKHSYYSRGWAGRKFTAGGEPIYDSVLSNATAHYLMNSLFFLEEEMAELECQTYRANPIETFDTAIVKGKTPSGVELFVAVTHAGDPAQQQNPLFIYECEKATLTFGSVGGKADVFRVQFKDGTEKVYENVNQGYQVPFWNMIEVLQGKDTIACTGEMARLHVATLEKMRQLQPESTPFPDSWVRDDGEFTWVPGLAEAMFDCFWKGEMPSWNLNADHLGGE